jgi:predicted nuclease with TOPRIM domain
VIDKRAEASLREKFATKQEEYKALLKERDANLRKLRASEKRIKELKAKGAKAADKLAAFLSVSDHETSRMTDILVRQLDHQIDIAKFFITLSATALFTFLGLPQYINGKLLVPLSAIVLIVASLMLAHFMRERKRLTDIHLSFYSEGRLKAYKSIYEIKND